MPKATVNEHSDASGDKSKIWPAPCASHWPIDPEAKP